MPLLISVQDFAFRGRPVSLLVAKAPAGSHLSRFSRRSLRLALQSKAGTGCNKKDYTEQMVIHCLNYCWMYSIEQTQKSFKRY
jgi:hypothetical protein